MLFATGRAKGREVCSHLRGTGASVAPPELKQKGKWKMDRVRLGSRDKVYVTGTAPEPSPEPPLK